MFQDIISYKLAEGVSEADMLKVADAVYNGWMGKKEGFIKWQVTRNQDGGYTDIVTWRSREDAKRAEEDTPNIPNGAEWRACYDMSAVTFIKVEQVAAFGE